MDWEVRVVGRRRPLPIETISGRVPPGRFRGGAFVKFDGATAEGVDFSGLNFEYLAAAGSTFVDCDFTRCRFESGSLSGSLTTLFQRCRFDRLRPGALLWGVSRFEACSFGDLRLKDWRVESTEFVACTFSGRIDGIVLCGVPQPPHDRPERLVPWRTRNEFRGNDFSRVDLRFPDFRWGVDVLANTWPSGPDYLLLDHWQERLERALAAVARWPEDDQRELALWWIGTERQDGRERQEATVLRPADWKSMAGVWERLVPVLRESIG